MKKQWTALWSLAERMERKFREPRPKDYYTIDKIYTDLFLKHHRNADSILMSYDGRPLEAVYKCVDLRDKKPSKYQDNLDARTSR